ncbi:MULTISPECIES: hypothetical protein [unclassified Rhodococcus (in: high G+C Gram-positive bacteria)]|nr:MULTISPECIES: hypothetical protein [unclassified Rhodococcus (in: high G+C Gram-positive bacteria)]
MTSQQPVSCRVFDLQVEPIGDPLDGVVPGAVDDEWADPLETILNTV